MVRANLRGPTNSTAWSDSAFIFTFDEAGGFYDHVPPIEEPLPDSYAPGQCPDTGVCTFGPSDMQATFNTSGLRLPLIVISPWAKPHYVSHAPRDTTAILAFIEETFNVPPRNQPGRILWCSSTRHERVLRLHYTGTAERTGWFGVECVPAAATDESALHSLVGEGSEILIRQRKSCAHS